MAVRIPPPTIPPAATSVSQCITSGPTYMADDSEVVDLGYIARVAFAAFDLQRTQFYRNTYQEADILGLQLELNALRRQLRELLRASDRTQQQLSEQSSDIQKLHAMCTALEEEVRQAETSTPTAPPNEYEHAGIAALNTAWGGTKFLHRDTTREITEFVVPQTFGHKKQLNGSSEGTCDAGQVHSPLPNTEETCPVP